MDGGQSAGVSIRQSPTLDLNPIQALSELVPVPLHEPFGKRLASIRESAGLHFRKGT